MQDNAKPHFARIVSAYFNEVQIEKLHMPPWNASLNPIEHLWEEMGHAGYDAIYQRIEPSASGLEWYHSNYDSNYDGKYASTYARGDRM